MTTFPKIPDRKPALTFSAQWLCLLTISVMEFLLLALGESIYEDTRQLMWLVIGGSLVLFWGVSLWQCSRCVMRRDVCLGILTVAWFLILELLRRSGQTSGQSIPLFLTVYLLALPFAAVAKDAHRQAGLLTAAGVFLAATACLLVLSLALFGVCRFPSAVQRFIFWKGDRIQIIHHPNILARIFMIAICLCLGFQERAKTVFIRGLLLGFTGLLFAGLALTNSRACILITCLVLAGNMFFRIWKGGCNRLIPALAAAAAVGMLAFLVYNAVFQWNSDRLLNPEAGFLTAGASLISPQGSWVADLPTLNSRTLIWAGALKRILDDPLILLRGAADTNIQLEQFLAYHSHNAWLETLLRLGLPGLLLSLAFSWRAGWASLHILRYTRAGMWKKNIAMMALAMMATSMLEPFLFVTAVRTHFFDFIFFLCLGYLTLWHQELREQHESGFSVTPQPHD